MSFATTKLSPLQVDFRLVDVHISPNRLHILVGIIVFVSTVLLLVPTAFAQIELNASGNAGIGSPPSSSSRLRVAADIGQKYAIYGTVSSSEPGTVYGVYGNTSLTGSGSAHGVYGSANSPSGTGAVYGVRAWARTYHGTAYGIYSQGTSYYGGGTFYAGFFSGNVTIMGTLSTPSDRTLKRDIRPLQGEGVLAKINRLRPTSYEHIRGESTSRMGLSTGRQYGLIAQEVEAIFPELVSEQTHVFPRPPAEEGTEVDVDAEEPHDEMITFKTVNYIELIPLLVQALQEQQERIEALEAALRVR